MLAQKTGSSQGFNARDTEERKLFGSPTPLREPSLFSSTETAVILFMIPLQKLIHNLLGKPLGSKSIEDFSLSWRAPRSFFITHWCSHSHRLLSRKVVETMVCLSTGTAQCSLLAGHADQGGSWCFVCLAVLVCTGWRFGFDKELQY